MLSNTYAVVQEDSEIEWKYSRVSLIITYARYSAVPPPLNIISSLINIITNTNAQVEPDIYLIENEQDNSKTTKTILSRYHQKKELLKKDYSIDVKDELRNLTEKINLINAYLLDQTDVFTPKKI